MYKRYSKARLSVAEVLMSGLPRLASLTVPVLLASIDPTLRPHFNYTSFTPPSEINDPEPGDWDGSTAKRTAQVSEER